MVVLSHMSLRIASAYNVIDIRKSQNRSLQMLAPSRFSLQIFLEAVERGACERIVGLSIRWGCRVVIRRNRGWGWPPSQSPLGKARHHRQIIGRAGAWSDRPRWIGLGLGPSPSPSSEAMATTGDFQVVVAVADGWCWW